MMTSLVSIAVVSIAAVSIAEPHRVMQLQCWVGLKQKFLFSYLREKFLLAFCKKAYEYISFSRKFWQQYSIRNTDLDSGTN
jgi:hypothetical protein